MKLYEVVEKEPEPNYETSVEYRRSWNADNTGPKHLAVIMSQLSLLKTTKVGLKEFWDNRNKKLIDQFIRATLKYGKRYTLSDEYSFDNYEDVVDSLFGRKEASPADIIFELEPGFKFKGNFEDDKFSITRIRHDKKEAERGIWARKEGEELAKL